MNRLFKKMWEGLIKLSLVCIVFLFFYPSITVVFAAEDLTLNLQWLNAPSGQEQNMTWSDPTNLSNNSQIVKYSLDIQTNNVSYDTGKLEIRIKRSLWTDRNGNKITPDSIGIPLAPTAGADVPFNYTIDEATDELVIVNTAPTEGAANYSIQVQYKINPWDTVSGSIGSFSAAAKGTDSSGGNTTATSPAITYQVNTGVETEKIKKQDPQPMYYWDPKYTGGKPEPADFDQYRWVSWRVEMGGKTNQPYYVKLTETPGQGGEVYAIVNGDVTGHELLGTDYVIQPDGTTIISKDYLTYGETGPAYGTDNSVRILVRYPKTSDTTLTNTITEDLIGKDDQIPHRTTSDTGSIEWKDYAFEYKDIESAMRKYSNLNSNQIDLMEYWSKFALLKAGVDLNVSWGMWATMDLYHGVNYTEGTTYSGELTDDFINWQLADSPGNNPLGSYIQMTPADYEYTSLVLTSETYTIDRSNGKKIYYTFKDINAPLIKVWVLIDGATDYQLVDQVYASELSYDTGVGGVAKTGKTINLPTGSYRVKLTYENATDHFSYKADLNAKIKANSPQIKVWTADTSNEGKRLRIQNFNYYKIFNEDGTLRIPATAADYSFKPEQGDNDTIRNNDQKNYGEYLHRSTAAVVLLDPVGQSASAKLAATPQNDTVNHVVNMEYWLYGSDMFQGLTNDEFNQMLAAGWTPPSRDEVTFYDLLPLGMFYNSQLPLAVYDINGNSDTATVHVQTVENFKGTGRQLVVFTVTAKEEGKNYNTTDSIMSPSKSPNGTVSMTKSYGHSFGISGYSIMYHGTVPWDNVAYAQSGVNLAAYQVPENRPLLGGGFPDDGSAVPMNSVLGDDGKPVFYDLRGNGVTGVHDTLYMSAQEPINVSVATASGLSKLVRAAEDGELGSYNSTAETEIGSSYTYQLKVGVGTNSTMKDVVLFDILEEANGTDSSWKGTFDSIDLNYARYQGIEPVVYYSTKPGLSYSGLSPASLTSGDWSTTEPADKSTITAIAVDLRYKVDGQEYVFSPLTGTKVLVHMLAPDMMAKAIFAYNRAAYYSTIKSSTGDTITSLNVGSRTTVKLYHDEISKTVTKVWNDSNNQAGERPAKIVIQLYADGIAYGSLVEINGLGNWKYTWEHLPQRVSATGPDVIYTAVEVGKLDNYQVSYSPDTFTITNTFSPEYTSKTVMKFWDDNNNQDKNRPDKVLVQLYANGVEYGSPVEINAENNWKYTWDYLRQSIMGTEVVYTVAEIGELTDYQVNYNDDTFTITNVYSPHYVSRTVIKIWDDNTDQAKNRPDKVMVQLYANGVEYSSPVELSLLTGWKYTWEYLPQRANGVDILYTAVEIGNLDEYQVNYSADTFTITNTYSPHFTSRTVMKFWDDMNDKDNLRPQKIKVQLYADGKEYGEVVTLQDTDNWRYTWNDLPLILNGKKVEYTLKEISVNSEYQTTYEGENGFIVVNKHTIKPDSPSTPNKNAPPTGYSNSCYLELSYVLLFIIYFIINRKKYSRLKDKIINTYSINNMGRLSNEKQKNK